MTQTELLKAVPDHWHDGDKVTVRISKINENDNENDNENEKEKEK